MKKGKKDILIKILTSCIGPILSLISFIVVYHYDPLKLSEKQDLASIPAFLLSIVVLLITQTIDISIESHKGNTNYGNIYDAVKTHLKVITMGTPDVAFNYVINNLKNLKEVRNTSLNYSTEIEKTTEQFYDTKIYKNGMNEIANFARNNIWKDIGDNYAIERFLHIEEKCKNQKYKYKLLPSNVPQINFIILIYKNGNKEVLFNWDFTGTGQEPTVLLSRDSQIINMFSIHYELLWNMSSEYHDSITTKSTSIK